MLETLGEVQNSPFAFLFNEPIPNHISLALKYYGLHEVEGAGSNPVIMKMAESLNPQVAAFYKEDDMAWCAVFAGFLLKTIGEPIPAGYDAMRALSYAQCGQPQRQAMLGDMLVLERQGGGHVCFYVGEDQNNFFVIGGNQRNMVCIIAVDKSRISAIRRLNYIAENQPSFIRPISIDFNAQVSTNES